MSAKIIDLAHERTRRKAAAYAQYAKERDYILAIEAELLSEKERGEISDDLRREAEALLDKHRPVWRKSWT